MHNWFTVVLLTEKKYWWNNRA